ncbi:MAG: PrsW family glutamic-type intramembrane protease [Candidatus Fermentibacteraceae bacterium]
MSILFLTLLALAPPIGFLIYILRFDRIEPEPMGFVARLLFLGVLSVVPAALIEGLFLECPLFAGEGLVQAGLQSFLVIAPVEEVMKLLVVLLFAWRSRNFNEPNDGIVYAGAVSIGFAMAENVLYVLEHGFGVGVARALTAIPGHTFTGVLMGRYIGVARFAHPRSRRIGYVTAGLLLAWLLHGLYDTFVLSGTGWALMVVPMVVLYFVMGIRYLKQGHAMSAQRWGTGGASAVTAVQRTPTRRTGFRRVVARVLLTLSGVFWLLIIAGVIHDAAVGARDSGYALLGGVLITALPITLGVLLEASGRRAVKTRENSG